MFYFIYNRVYGGIENFDTGKFYNDARAINQFAFTDFSSYLRIIFGFQDDTFGSYEYVNSRLHTVNWDNGTMKDYLYNDNRIVIRVHAVLHLIAFNSYYVHALFNCFLSFIGIVYLYKSLKEFFAGKELAILFILCFLPALWFYTGGLLKEGITFFVFGSTLYFLKKMIDGGRYLPDIIYLLFLIFVSVLLKPYLLAFSVICFSLFFIILRSQKIQRKILWFTSIMFFLILLINSASLVVKRKSLLSAAFNQQRIFAGVAKGGIFLYNEAVFIRLPFDSTLTKKITGKDSTFKIKKDVSYMYWETPNNQDTLYVRSNTDTLSEYTLAYKFAKSNSNIDQQIYSGNTLKIVASCLYYSLLYPLFFNAKNALQFLASFENLAILLALFVIIKGFIKNKRVHYPVFVFLFFAFSLCVLIGLTTPNSGAIFRYRSAAVIFILLSALYYNKAFKMPFFKKTN